VLAILLVLTGELMQSHERLVVVGLLFCGIALFFNRGRPVVLAGVVLLAFLMIFLADVRGGRIITQERTFFGVLRTRQIEGVTFPPVRTLLHGTTLHGAQIVAPGRSREPLTYYNPNTALGEAIGAGLRVRERSRLALIGLGTGSTACLMDADDDLTIYEIDPAVVQLSMAADGDFTFVRECQPDARLVLGDARLRIADAPDGSYDVIVVDAFSSDAIPAHLLTREAVTLYLRKVSERGVVILHLSNRNLALVSEAARVTRDLGAPALYRMSHEFELDPPVPYGASAASVMIVARSPETLAELALTNVWTEHAAPPGRGWTDDYINLPRALWDQLSGAEECRLYPQLPRCGGAPESPPAAVAVPAAN
ncbi:MAG: spermidine synthase, partial [Vitreimonas sp.]